jgi:tetratricopeptide (TPR) repeat protein
MRRAPTPEEIQYKKNMEQFESGVKLFNHGDFSKASQIFEALSKASAQDLAQRARMYMNICSQRLSQPALRLKTADDFYNYAVSMANRGNRDEAETNLNKALKLEPKADHIYYALATTQALRDNVEGALENLQKAIELNARNRYLAQNDSDFEILGEDPRFTELIYPEKPMS